MNAFGDSVLPFKLYLMSAYLAELTWQDTGARYREGAVSNTTQCEPIDESNMFPRPILYEAVEFCCWSNKVYGVVERDSSLFFGYILGVVS